MACALTLAAGDIALARIGGGSSFGSRGTRTYSAPPSTSTAPSTAAPMERSMTQPTRPNAAGPATNGFGASRPGMFGGMFSGFGGGLLAGFLGAGLLGMLFGHGFAGGLGGIASLFGFLLQVGLIALIGMFLWRMWQNRRQQPATASGPQGVYDFNRSERSDLGGRPLGLGSLGLGGGSSAQAGPSDEVGIGPSDYDAFERLLKEIQGAYSDEDLSGLRSRVTPEMLSYFSEELAQNQSRGVVNKIADVKLEKGDLAEAWREGDAEYATVAMRFSLDDRMVDRASGREVSGGRETVTELWTFRRARGGTWTLSAIQQTR